MSLRAAGVSRAASDERVRLRCVGSSLTDDLVLWLSPTEFRSGVVPAALVGVAATLRDHAGEVAFPGGAREAGDVAPVATAIREAAEETGVNPATVEPLILLPRLHIPPSRLT